MAYNHVSDKYMFVSFRNLMYTKFKENNGNAIIMKYYANYKFQYDV